MCLSSATELDDPYDRFALAARPVYQMALPPKVAVNPIACTLSIPEWTQIISQNRWLYVFGIANYKDTFDTRVTHRAEFCLMTHTIVEKGVGLSTIQNQCARHNCTDDECSSDDEPLKPSL